MNNYSEHDYSETSELLRFGNEVARHETAEKRLAIILSALDIAALCTSLSAAWAWEEEEVTALKPELVKPAHPIVKRLLGGSHGGNLPSGGITSSAPHQEHDGITAKRADPQDDGRGKPELARDPRPGATVGGVNDLARSSTDGEQSPDPAPLLGTPSDRIEPIDQ